MPRGGFYDPLDHSYWWKGERVPSVTQVIKQAGYLDLRWLTPEAAARGTAVHRFCELYDLARRPNATPADLERFAAFRAAHQALRPYTDGYEAFTRDMRPEYVAIEVARFSTRLRLGGRPDRIVRRMGQIGRHGVLEIKTGAEHDWHGLQTAGYQLIRPAGARTAVYLPGNGRYRLRRFTDAGDYRKFLDALEEAHRNGQSHNDDR